jgi:hypothetical protein
MYDEQAQPVQIYIVKQMHTSRLPYCAARCAGVQPLLACASSQSSVTPASIAVLLVLLTAVCRLYRASIAVVALLVAAKCAGVAPVVVVQCRNVTIARYSDGFKHLKLRCCATLTVLHA